jgi:hypothetical protein
VNVNLFKMSHIEKKSSTRKRVSSSDPNPSPSKHTDKKFRVTSVVSNQPSTTFDFSNNSSFPSPLRQSFDPVQSSTTAEGRDTVCVTPGQNIFKDTIRVVDRPLRVHVTGSLMSFTPIPKDTSLIEICRNYPNHLIGDGLNSFIGVMTPKQIFDNMPQAAKHQSKGTNRHNFIQKRIQAQKAKLEQQGRLVAITQANLAREQAREQNLDYADDVEDAAEGVRTKFDKPISKSTDEALTSLQSAQDIEPKTIKERSKVTVLKINPERLKKLMNETMEKENNLVAQTGYKGIGESDMLLPTGQVNRVNDQMDTTRMGSITNITSRPMGPFAHFIQRPGNIHIDPRYHAQMAGPATVSTPISSQPGMQNHPTQPRNIPASLAHQYQFEPLKSIPALHQFVIDPRQNSNYIAATAMEDAVNMEVSYQLRLIPLLLLYDPRISDKSAMSLNHAAERYWIGQVKIFKMQYPKVSRDDVHEPPIVPNEPARKVSWYMGEMFRIIELGWERANRLQVPAENPDGSELSPAHRERREHMKYAASLTEMFGFLRTWTAAWDKIRNDFAHHHPNPATLKTLEGEMREQYANHQALVQQRLHAEQEFRQQMHAQAQFYQEQQDKQKKAQVILQSPELRSLARLMPNPQEFLQGLHVTATTPVLPNLIGGAHQKLFSSNTQQTGPRPHFIPMLMTEQFPLRLNMPMAVGIPGSHIQAPTPVAATVAFSPRAELPWQLSPIGHTFDTADEQLRQPAKRIDKGKGKEKEIEMETADTSVTKGGDGTLTVDTVTVDGRVNDNDDDVDAGHTPESAQENTVDLTPLGEPPFNYVDPKDLMSD